MNILILDDLDTRHNTFKKIYINDRIISVYKYNEFLKHLNVKWDLIHLDHDFGDFVSEVDTYVDGWGSIREYDGCHAAMRICELSDDLKPSKVIVHSVNSVCAPNMIKMLERAEIDAIWEPFGEVS